MKTYLGDGVYASFDGYAIVLSTEDGLHVTNMIYMEPSVLRALDAYVKAIGEKREDEKAS